MGQEFFAKGTNVQLGPGLNVMRLPQDGRNFEYVVYPIINHKWCNKNGAIAGFEMYFWSSDPSTLGAGGPNPNTPRNQVV